MIDDYEIIGTITENVKIIAATKINIADIVKRRLSYELVWRRSFRNFNLLLSVILDAIDLKIFEKFTLQRQIN